MNSLLHFLCQCRHRGALIALGNPDDDRAVDDDLCIARSQAQRLMLGNAFARKPLAYAGVHSAPDVLYNRVNRTIAVVEIVDAHQSERYQIVQAGKGIESTAAHRHDFIIVLCFPLPHQAESRAVGNAKAALTCLVEPCNAQLRIFLLFFTQQSHPGLKTILKALQCFDYGLRLPVGAHKHHIWILSHGLDSARFVHSPVVGHEKRRAFVF